MLINFLTSLAKLGILIISGMASGNSINDIIDELPKGLQLSELPTKESILIKK